LQGYLSRPPLPDQFGNPLQPFYNQRSNITNQTHIGNSIPNLGRPNMIPPHQQFLARPPSSANGENGDFIKNMMPINVNFPFASNMPPVYPPPPVSYPNFPGNFMPQVPKNLGEYEMQKSGTPNNCLHPQNPPYQPQYNYLNSYQKNLNSSQISSNQQQDQPNYFYSQPQMPTLPFNYPKDLPDRNSGTIPKAEAYQGLPNEFNQGFSPQNVPQLPRANTQNESLDENQNEDNSFNVWDFSEEDISKSIILLNLKEGVKEADIVSILSAIAELATFRFLSQSNGQSFAIATFKDAASVPMVLAKTKTSGHIYKFNHDILREILNENHEMTQRAINRLQNPEIMAKLLCDKDHLLNYFNFILSKKPLAFYGNTIRVREIWIGNLSSQITETSLSNVLSQFGPVDNIDLFVKHQSFAFVRFVTADSATRCVDSQDHLFKQLGQIKVSYSDFLKRTNIVGDDPYSSDNSSQLTNIVYLGVPYASNLPTEKLIADKFGEFGKVVNILSRPSVNETHKSYSLVEMETKEQAKKIRRYFFIEDRDSKRRMKLADKKMEVNILLKPNVNGNLSDLISPFVSLPSLSLQEPNKDKNSILTKMLFGSKLKAESTATISENLIWTGFITKNRKNMVGTDAICIFGNEKELFDDQVFNLNITHKATLIEVLSKDPFGAVSFRASNSTYEESFSELASYLKEKNICGVVKHLEKSVLYIMPYFDEIKEFTLNCQPNDLIGMFFKNEESVAQELVQSNQEII
jgi:hypothetical protein